jgi:hypothetical protein
MTPGGWGFEVMGPAGRNGLGSTFAMWASAGPCPALWRELMHCSKRRARNFRGTERYGISGVWQFHFAAKACVRSHCHHLPRAASRRRRL